MLLELTFVPVLNTQLFNLYRLIGASLSTGLGYLTDVLVSTDRTKVVPDKQTERQNDTANQSVRDLN
jgi:hypothetical protein